jgi:hypothetical protein
MRFSRLPFALLKSAVDGSRRDPRLASRTRPASTRRRTRSIVRSHLLARRSLPPLFRNSHELMTRFLPSRDRDRQRSAVTSRGSHESRTFQTKLTLSPLLAVEAHVKASIHDTYPEHKFIGEEETSAGQRPPLTDAPTYFALPPPSLISASKLTTLSGLCLAGSSTRSMERPT